MVRNMAFFCLGSASLLDINQAQKYFHLLLQVGLSYIHVALCNVIRDIGSSCEVLMAQDFD